MRTDVAGIKACQGLYSIGAVAKHYGISKSTVWNIWNNRTHTDIGAAPDAPNITVPRVPKDIVLDEYKVLKHRGMNVEEIAKTIGVGRSTLYSVLREVAA